SATHDNQIRIENINERRYGARETVVEDIHRLACLQVARFCEARDLTGVELAAGSSREVAGQSRTTDPAFDASATTAIALRCVLDFLDGGRRKRVVAPFSSDCVRTSDGATSYAEPATHARSRDDAEHDIGSRSGAIARLGKRETIRI